MSLRFLTAGESHGPALTVIVEGLPAGVPFDRARLERDLARRQGGYGRGARMKIENDCVEVLGGIRFGKTLGSPVSLVIRNKDHANWLAPMNIEGAHPGDKAARAVTRPRPGHADLAGALKYATHDARDILERSSARETAARTAAGALARALLGEAGVEVTSRTVAVGRVVAPDLADADFDQLLALPDAAPLRTIDALSCQSMIDEIDRVRAAGDSVGGIFELLARGVPAGLGSHVHWDRRLDARLGGAILSIQAVKAVSVGEGIEGASRLGSEHHDPIDYDDETHQFKRPSNRAGGIEGGMSNGEMVRISGYFKPLSSLPRPMRSIDLNTKESALGTRERTDVMPIVAAGVIGEAMLCLTLADEFLTKFGGDHLEETLKNYTSYRDGLLNY